MNIEKINDLLRVKKLTQKDLAEGINMSRANINYILIGKQDPKVSTLEKIAKFLNVDVKFFFDDSNISQTILGNVCERKIITCVEDVLHSEVTCQNIQVLKDRILVLHEVMRAKSQIINLLENKMFA